MYEKNMTMSEYCSLPKLSGSTLLQSFPREVPGGAARHWALLAAMHCGSQTCMRSHPVGTEAGEAVHYRIASLEKLHAPDS